MDEFQFRPIGWIESPYKEKFGTPRQPGLVDSPLGAVVLRDDLNVDALEGLADYSHVWLIFVFHANQSFKTGKPFEKTKVHPPRLKGASVGVFATRSPHRPNPIGLSLVKIERIEGRKIFVRGLDLIEGTPVLDVKPYLPSVESPAGATEGWSAKATNADFEIEWGDEALSQLTGHQGSSLDELKNSIEQILRLDPRPVAYRGTEENPDPYMSSYGFRFQNWNVVFEMISPEDNSKKRLARIVRIEPWTTSSVQRPR